MAITNHDDFVNLFKRHASNPRFENWLYHSMRSCGQINESAGMANFRKDAAFYIKQNCQQNSWVEQQYVEGIKQAYEQVAVNRELLEWINDDPWQNRWIKQQLWGVNIFHMPNLASMAKSILLIDAWQQHDGLSKGDAVENLKKNWLDQTAKDKKYLWFFDVHKEEKLSMLTDWVQKNIQPGQTQVQQFHEAVDVLVFFNINLSINKNDAKICLDAIKKRWSQVKYRNSLEGKQQCNMILSDKSLKFLDEMADKYLLRRAQILEILIRSEAKQERYISEWIKVAKSTE